MAHEEAPDSHPLILADEKGQIVVQPKTRLETLDSDVRSPSREPTRQQIRELKEDVEEDRGNTTKLDGNADEGEGSTAVQMGTLTEFLSADWAD